VWLLKRALRLGRRLFECLVEFEGVAGFVDRESFFRSFFFSQGGTHLWIEDFSAALAMRNKAGEEMEGGFSVFFSLILVCNLTLKGTAVNR
jgi:hypothetical protein